MLHPKLLFGLIFFAVIYSVHLSLSSENVKAYFAKRNSLLREFKRDFIGAHLILTQKEVLVNDKFMKFKYAEFERGLRNSASFPAAQHFFRAKSLIEESTVFKIIKKLPKGASLHSHDTALVSEEYIFSNITHRDNLYVQRTENNRFVIRFFGNHPGNPWTPIASYRKSHEGFDEKLKLQMTMVRDDPEIFYRNQESVWEVFEDIFTFLNPILTYKPVFEQYFYQALKELYEDNVKYLEFRGLLPQLYDLEGNVYGPEDVIRIYYETSRKFQEDNPDFWGVKFIFAPHRSITNEAVEKHVFFVAEMQRKFPEFIAGFDLVGQEDAGPPLKNFIPALLKMKDVTNLILHAGETLWNGAQADKNLIDAVLLNVTRIGHGFAILKHPEALKMLRKKRIALEICPISNQVLGFIKDLRNHPANYLIANSYPMVIAPDDPGIWGAKGLSYDWYMTFMGMSSRGADLRLLKQLAINSIEFSSMKGKMKKEVLYSWTKDWEEFLDTIIANNY